MLALYTSFTSRPNSTLAVSLPAALVHFAFSVGYTLLSPIQALYYSILNVFYDKKIQLSERSSEDLLFHVSRARLLLVVMLNLYDIFIVFTVILGVYIFTNAQKFKAHIKIP